MQILETNTLQTSSVLLTETQQEKFRSLNKEESKKSLLSLEKTLVQSDPFRLIENEYLKIKTKTGELIALKLNKAQLRLHNKIKELWKQKKIIRILILKARQLGISTYIEALIYAITSQKPNTNSVIIADDKDGSSYIFEMSKLYQETCPSFLKPDTKKSNEIKLEFQNTHSQILIDTAQNKEAGRKYTFRAVHLSEYAFFPKNNADLIMLGLSHSVPSMERTIIIKETTANGFNFFRDEWNEACDGMNDYIPIFIPWYWGEDYKMPVPDGFEVGDPSLGEITQNEPDLYNRMMEEGISDIEQRLQWRRWDIRNNCKGDVSKFNQENPSCVISDTWVSHRRGIERIGKNPDRIVNGQALIYKVKTKKGYLLECTANHYIHNCTKYKPLRDFKIGDYISLLPITFNKDIQRIKFKHRFNCVNSVITVNKDFARFVGLFMGDGCLTGKHEQYCLEMACCPKDEDVINECIRLVTKLFSKPNIKRGTVKNKCVYVRISNKYFKDLFYNLGLIYQNSSKNFRRKVHVPDWIIKSPKHIIKEFLKGIFETDGFVGYKTPRIVLFSKHEHFLRDIQMLLLGFGITSAIHIADKINDKGQKYIGRELRLKSNETKLFMKEIGFISNRKNIRFKTFPKKGWNASPIEMRDEIVSIDEDSIRDVFNLTTDEHYYSANGIWTHNSPEEAFIASGKCFFDQKKLIKHLKSLKRPLFRANLLKDNYNVVMRPHDDGDFIFFHPKKSDGQYCIGGDACSGSGEDYSVLIARDKLTNEIVCMFRAKCDSDELAYRAMLLGTYLNFAKIAIENDKFGFAANEKLKTIYSNIYIQRAYNKQLDKFTEKFGWNTTAITRPMMLGQMREEIREDSLVLPDRVLIRECLTFIENSETKKPEAEQGSNDDTVIACAISGQIRKEEPFQYRQKGRTDNKVVFQDNI